MLLKLKVTKMVLPFSKLNYQADLKHGRKEDASFVSPKIATTLPLIGGPTTISGVISTPSGEVIDSPFFNLPYKGPEKNALNYIN